MLAPKTEKVKAEKQEVIYNERFIGNVRFMCACTKSGAPGRLEKDIDVVGPILEKATAGNELTRAERLELLRIYNVSYHDSGKIEGVFSLDSTATNCAFCAIMRELAKINPDMVCAHCYDHAQEAYRSGVLNRHTLNMLIMATVDFTVDELAFLTAGLYNRVNSSGDAPNDTYAANMIKYAIAHPASRVSIWTKNAMAYIHAVEKYGKPANVIMIYSSYCTDKPMPLPRHFDYVFTVYKDAAKVAAAIAAGACECNGKKCKDCGYKCYTGAWAKGSNIAELLR